MSDLNALLKAIIAAPDDDTVRLAYADELEGADTVSMVCPKCEGRKQVTGYSNNATMLMGCETCDGAGSVPDTTNRDRAEFIRVQVELAGHIASEIGGVRHYRQGVLGKRTAYLERREKELIVSVSSLKVEGFIQVRSHDYFGALDNHKTSAYRRGFIESIKCPAETFLQHADALIWTPTVACPECKGHGFIAYHSEGECPTCGRPGVIGTGRVPNPAPCPDTAQPIRKVVLTTAPEFRLDWFAGTIQLIGAEDRWKSWPWGGVHALESAKYCLINEFPGIEFVLPEVH